MTVILNTIYLIRAINDFIANSNGKNIEKILTKFVSYIVASHCDSAMNKNVSGLITKVWNYIESPTANIQTNPTL